MKKLFVVLIALSFAAACFAEGKQFELRSVLLQNEVKTTPNDEFMFAVGEDKTPSKVYVDKNVLLSTKDIEKLSVIKTVAEDRDSVPEIIVKFKAPAAKKLKEVTKGLTGRSLAVVVGGQLICMPYVRRPFDDGTIYLSGTAII